MSATGGDGLLFIITVDEDVLCCLSMFRINFGWTEERKVVGFLSLTNFRHQKIVFILCDSSLVLSGNTEDFNPAHRVARGSKSQPTSGKRHGGQKGFNRR